MSAEFNEVFSKAVDTTLTNYYGSNIKQAVYDFFEKHNYYDALRNPRVFDEAIGEMFSGGSGVIKAIVVKTLYNMLELDLLDNVSENFIKQVQMAKRYYRKR